MALESDHSADWDAVRVMIDCLRDSMDPESLEEHCLTEVLVRGWGLQEKSRSLNDGRSCSTAVLYGVCLPFDCEISHLAALRGEGPVRATLRVHKVAQKASV